MRLAAAALLSLSVAASAPGATPRQSLGEEEFGNKPVVKQAEWAVGVLDVANDPSRVYRRWVNGNEDFCFAGGAAELNRCLLAFSAVEADRREVILLPSAGSTRSFEDKLVAFNWRLNVPSGIYRAMTEREDDQAPELHAMLYVHLTQSKPRMADLRIPAGVTILGPDEVAARLIANFEDSESRRRGYSLSLLGDYTYVDSAIETLLGVLRGDDERLQPTAAHQLAAAGVRGRAGIERLEELLRAARKAGQALPDGRVDWRSQMFADALVKLQAAESGPRDEDAEEKFSKHLAALRALVRAHAEAATAEPAPGSDDK